MEKSQYYLGVVTSIDDDSLRAKEYHEVLVDIPEVAKGIKAFPKRGEVDEPQVGDIVLLLSLDPVYNSYMIYEKLKENDFIGFRASGKMIDITPSAITVGVYSSSEHKDKERPDVSGCYIKLDKDNNITVEASGEYKLTVKGEITIECDSDVNVHTKSGCTVKVDQDAKVEVLGDADIDVTGSTVVKSPKVTIDGDEVKITGGMLETKGNVIPTDGGPYCAIPKCLFTAAPHQGNTVYNT